MPDLTIYFLNKKNMQTMSMKTYITGKSGNEIKKISKPPYKHNKTKTAKDIKVNLNIFFIVQQYILR